MSDVAMRFSQTMLESKWMGGYPCKMHRTAKGESHLASGAAERTKKGARSCGKPQERTAALLDISNVEPQFGATMCRQKGQTKVSNASTPYVRGGGLRRNRLRVCCTWSKMQC